MTEDPMGRARVPLNRGAPSEQQRPELSVATSFNYQLAIDVQLPMIAAVGFTHVSLGAEVSHADYLSREGRTRLLEHLRRHDLRVDTIHGPRADQPDSLRMLTATAEAALHLNPDRFGFCYDSSPDQIGGPRPFDLLVELRDRLIAVQLSDRIRDFVDHVIPGEGFIDWHVLASVLRTSSFRGPLLFEVSMTHSAEKDPSRFLRLTYDRARSLFG
jgi:hypothetical protein